MDTQYSLMKNSIKEVNKIFGGAIILIINRGSYIFRKNSKLDVIYCKYTVESIVVMEIKVHNLELGNLDITIL